MQESKTISEERPRQAKQVVPLEPSLRARYWLLLVDVALLLLFIVNFQFAFNPVILNHSFFSLLILYVLIILVLHIFPLKRWRMLNERRQQMARYNLTTGAWERAVAPQADTLELPDTFVIASQRHWLATFISALLYGLFLCLLGAITYTFNQAMLLATYYGLSLPVVIWEILLNIVYVLFLAWLPLRWLIFSPRQQLIATRDGLLCCRGYRTSYIPWQQATLFAVIGKSSRKAGAVLFYELASKNATIRWPSANVFVPRGIGTRIPTAMPFLYNLLVRPFPIGEFQQQVQFLNSIVAERTRLPLYDLCQE